MGKIATINVRVDEADKRSAEKVLKQLGMPMSTLVNLLLKQVSLTKSVPFDISLPVDAPASVRVDGMTADEFGQMMVEDYREAQTNQGRPSSEFLAEFRAKIANEFGPMMVEAYREAQTNQGRPSSEFLAASEAMIAEFGQMMEEIRREAQTNQGRPSSEFRAKMAEFRAKMAEQAYD